MKPATAAKLYKTIQSGRLPDWQNFEDKYGKMSEAMGQEDHALQFDAMKSYFRKRELESMGVKIVSRAHPVLPVHLDLVTELMRIDMSFSLIDDMLTKVDRAAMTVALENREPMLDNKIVEYSSQLPLEFKYKDGKTKNILRKILYNSMLKFFDLDVSSR